MGKKWADLMATSGQFYWPSVGNSVAAYGQVFMAADICPRYQRKGLWSAEMPVRDLLHVEPAPDMRRTAFVFRSLGVRQFRCGC